MIKSIKGIDAYTYKLKRRTDDLGKKSHTCTKVSEYVLFVCIVTIWYLCTRGQIYLFQMYCLRIVTGMVWYGMARHGKAWHGMAWYDNTAAAATTSGSFSFH